MIITAIKQQPKRAGRYSVFVDEEYVFSLSADALLSSGLVQGHELSQAELTDWKKASQDDKAYSQTINYIARRMRSEGELRQYFKRKGWENAGQAMLPRLKNLGLVNDIEFTRRWIENRRLLKTTRAKKLRLELREKLVADEIISQALAEDTTDERQILKELIDRKRQQTRYHDDQKLIAYLAHQGFNYDDIKAVLS